jgi:hypothetical protein
MENEEVKTISCQDWEILKKYWHNHHLVIGEMRERIVFRLFKSIHNMIFPLPDNFGDYIYRLKMSGVNHKSTTSSRVKENMYIFTVQFRRIQDMTGKAETS